MRLSNVRGFHFLPKKPHKILETKGVSMKNLFELSNKYENVNVNDIVFTPDWLAKKICDMFKIEGKCLEPCKGEGVFLKYMPKDSLWCEITEGRNFFDFNEKVDWIVTNPPYSNFNEFLHHSFEIANNIVFLVPFAKVFKSMGTIKKIMNFGNIVSIGVLPASQAGFPFGFPCGVFYFKKGYNGNTNIYMIGEDL